MADVTGKTPGKGLLDSLGIGKLFGAPSKAGPGPGLVGEPAEPAAQRVFKERLTALKPEQRKAYEDFVDRMPVYQDDPAVTDQADQIVLPTAQIAYSTDHGKETNNEDGVFVDPLLDIGVVVDGVSHGGNGRRATEAALRAIRQWTKPEQAGVLQGELRTRSIKNTPENRLKLIGHKARAAVREALDLDVVGGAVVAGTLIEGNKLYSFVLGDSMNMVIRNEKVVFCSRPTSRLQRFVDIYNVPPNEVKAKLDVYLATTPIEKIRSELNYTSSINLEKIKHIIRSDPGKVLGDEGVDVSVEEFDLQPDDTVISVTDGILGPLDLRVIPTKKDKKTGRWVFDPAYGSTRMFASSMLDPLKLLGQLVGRNAEETRMNILELFKPGNQGAGGKDHKTILVRRHSVPVLTEDTPLTLEGRSVPRLEVIGPGYAEENTPVDEARRGMVRLPPLVIDEEEESGPALLPLPTLTATEPLPSLPRPDTVSVERIREVTGLRTELQSLAVVEYDIRYVDKDIRRADALLWNIWDIEHRLAVLEGVQGQAKQVRPQVEWFKVYKNYLRHELSQAETGQRSDEQEYAQSVKLKQWFDAYRYLYYGLYSDRVRHITNSYRLAWAEGRFDLLKHQPIEVSDDQGVQRMQVAETFPPNDPDLPNVVVMHILGADGKPTKRIALTVAEWQRKLKKGADVHVVRDAVPFESSQLITEVTKSVDMVRLWYRAGHFGLKLEQGRFAGTAYEPLYQELRAALSRFPEGYVPNAQQPNQLAEYTEWADQIENLQVRLQALTKTVK